MKIAIIGSDELNSSDEMIMCMEDAIFYHIDKKDKSNKIITNNFTGAGLNAAFIASINMLDITKLNKNNKIHEYADMCLGFINFDIKDPKAKDICDCANEFINLKKEVHIYRCFDDDFPLFTKALQSFPFNDKSP